MVLVDDIPLPPGVLDQHGQLATLAPADDSSSSSSAMAAAAPAEDVDAGGDKDEALDGEALFRWLVEGNAPTYTAVQVPRTDAPHRTREARVCLLPSGNSPAGRSQSKLHTAGERCGFQVYVHTWDGHVRTHEKYWDSQPPPAYWIRKTCPTASAEDAMTRWRLLDGKTRGAEVRQQKRHEDSMAYRAGKTDSRSLTFLAQGGANRQHDSAVDRQSWNNKRAVARKSVAWLLFLRQKMLGCSVAGCPLGPVAGVEPIFALLNWDHLHDKLEMVYKLSASQWEKEIAKCRVMCLWHHHLVTAQQRGFRTLAELKSSTGTKQCTLFAEHKLATGCQHPQHYALPYSSLWIVHPHLHSFLQRSQILRGVATLPENKIKQGEQRAAMHLDHCSRGLAVIHCHFCHALYTRLEAEIANSSPFLRAEVVKIAQRYPEFVREFVTKQSVINFDWKGYAEEAADKISKSKSRNELGDEEEDEVDQAAGYPAEEAMTDLGGAGTSASSVPASTTQPAGAGTDVPAGGGVCSMAQGRFGRVWGPPPSQIGNDIRQTNVPDIRIQYRAELLGDEFRMLHHHSKLSFDDSLIDRLM